MKKQHPTFDKVDAAVYKIIRVISYLAAFFLLAIMVLAVVNVILEKAHKMGVPVSGIGDTKQWIQYMNICVVYFATAFVTLERGHSNMDLLTRRYPVIVQKILTVVAYVAGTAVFGYIGYLGIVKVLAGQLANNARINETLSTSFPQWPFGAVYAFGFLILSFSCLWGVVRVCFGKNVAQEAVDVEAKNAELLKEAAAEAALAANNGEEGAE